MVSTRSQTIKQLTAKEGTTEPHTRVKDSPKKVRLRQARRSSLVRKDSYRSTASSPATQKTLSGRITKSQKPIAWVSTESSTGVDVLTATETTRKRARRSRTSLTVKLRRINYDHLPESIRQQDYRIIRQRKRLANFRGKYMPPQIGTYKNHYHFKFDHNPFRHIGFKGPSIEQQWSVYHLIEKDLKDNFGKECFLDQPDASTNETQGGPLHMSDELSIDNFVKVILSISTENSLAIRQHAQLCSRFTYTIDGKEIKGQVPNYHRMRLCSPQYLMKALNIAGYQNIRQRAFHAILDEVYQQNVSRLRPDEVIQEGNLVGVGDFVPGLLSMEYLKDDGLSKQERFDLLVKFDQIAVKTGCCLLAFNLKIPVFVVDTHVHHMARNLRWIPTHCDDADKACMFLDAIMPDRLKFGLHQAFWHHRINCVRCMPRANTKSLAYQQRICPLEHLISRNLPPFARATVADGEKDKASVKIGRKDNQAGTTKKLPGSITFLNVHYKVAEERGYVLRKVEIDDDFGDGLRQNKERVANFYWGQRELAHADDMVRIEEALDVIGMTMEAYEARFARKARKSSDPDTKSKRPRTKRRQRAGVFEDITMDIDGKQKPDEEISTTYRLSEHDDEEEEDDDDDNDDDYNDDDDDDDDYED